MENEAIYTFLFVITYTAVICLIDIRPRYERIVQIINWLLLSLIFLRLLYLLENEGGI